MTDALQRSNYDRRSIKTIHFLYLRQFSPIMCDFWLELSSYSLPPLSFSLHCRLLHGLCKCLLKSICLSLSSSPTILPIKINESVCTIGPYVSWSVRQFVHLLRFFSVSNDIVCLWVSCTSACVWLCLTPCLSMHGCTSLCGFRTTHISGEISAQKPTHN